MWRRACILLTVILAALVPSIVHATDRPIVLIPGILGSVLKDRNGDVVWGDVSSLTGLKRLLIAGGPKDPEDGIVPSRLIDDVAILGSLKIKQYSVLRNMLLKMGYREGFDYFEFPYDWRESNFTTAEKFSQFVSSKPALSGKQFDIIAHSMGGLVAKIYANTLDHDGRVKRVINLAVPFLGSVNTMTTLADGWGGKLASVVGVTQGLRELALSFPSFYELMPSYDRCCILGLPNSDRAPYSLFDVAGWNRLEWGVQLDDAGFKAALGNAQKLHKIVAEPYPPNVTAYNIVGSEVSTAWQYYVDPNKKAIGAFNYGSGDGTVPSGSAAYPHPDRAFSSLAQHQNIFADVAAEAVLRRILADNGLPQKYASSANAAKGKDGKPIEITSVSARAGASAVEAGENVDVSVEIHAKAGANLDGLQVSVSPSGETTEPKLVPLTRKLDSTGIESKAIYTGSFPAGRDAGYITVSADIVGLPELQDYVAVLPAAQR